MANWDQDSPELRTNLANVLIGVREDAKNRVLPTLKMPLIWQTNIMQNLVADDPLYVGNYRGAAREIIAKKGALKKDISKLNVNVRVGGYLGTDYTEVANELASFETRLQAVIANLDEKIPIEHPLTADELAAVIDVCAWAHSEWVRIHPFANGNGRTARLWANFIAMRYGLPPFVRLRPRPDSGYGMAASAAMQGDWEPTVGLFRNMLDDLLK